MGFGIGGLADMAWHEIFGIEKGIEALLSPSHITLAVSMGLVVSGPLRASWRSNARGWQQLPSVLSLALTLSIVTFFTQSAHPVAQLWGARNLHGWRDDDFAATALLFGQGILVAGALFALRNGKPTPGTFTVLFGLNAFGMGFLNSRIYPTQFVLAFVVAGALLDGLCAALQPSQPQPAAWRMFVFAALVPVALLGAYFITLHNTFGLTWRIHFWLGLIAMSSVGALILCAMLRGPASPAAHYP
jgi:hypothetical protein